MLLAFLELILRVRQACCHAGLVPAERRENATHVLDIIQKSKGGELPPDLAEDLLAALRGVRESEQLHECVVCRNELEEESTMILRECKHIFCEACLNSIQNQVCPMCRVPYGPDDMISKKTAEASAKPAAKSEVKNATRDVKNSSKLGRSPKVQALLDEIDKMAPDEKGVIFSQWTSFLDLIEIELSKEGHTYTRVDGTMSADRRVEAMEDFDTEGCDSMKTPRFILCSLMACGTGINLVRGNVVFLMDCWWNAAAENQAMDRCHRIGQHRPVRVFRFLMRDSLETRMVALQESKSALGKGSLQKLKPAEKRKARMTTLHDLFQVKNVEELWDD